MQIDWFTFVVQIINFMILVWLLQRFLYRPIIRAMNQRKLQIQATLDEAEDKRKEAEQKAAAYQQELEKLEQKKEQMLLKARKTAEIEKEKLLQEVRTEIDKTKSLWYQKIQLEKEEFINSLRRRTSEEIQRILRQTLGDMANVKLEEQMLEVFLQRLRQGEAAKLTEIAEAVAQSNQVIIVSSPFPISPEKRQAIIEVIQGKISPEIEVEFETVADLICGICLRGGGQEIAWSLESYLRTLEENFKAMLEGKERINNEIIDLN